MLIRDKISLLDPDTFILDTTFYFLISSVMINIGFHSLLIPSPILPELLSNFCFLRLQWYSIDMKELDHTSLINPSNYPTHPQAMS